VIALVDYGAGNLTSVRKAFAAIGTDLFVPASPADLRRASAIVVPGVGNFAATRRITAGWLETIRELLAAGRPFLGVCLGMQWLYEGSDEAPEVPGLGVLAGRITRLDSACHPGEPGQRIKIPHVGWNGLAVRRTATLTEGIEPRTQVYFTHSYAAPVTDDTVATTDHGATFTAIVERDRLAGVQFHPEKSGEAGLRILRNFLRGTAG
jgi:glutamine amidotransferase